MPRLLAAPDKFRGTATAGEVAGAVRRAATSCGWTADAVPLSDGGDGLLAVLDPGSSRLRVTEVTGPNGAKVPAPWLLTGSTAVIELARASGLALAGGPGRNDPLAATTRGTGELMVAAARAVGDGGTVVVGLGGSASTDGGLAALEAVEEQGGLGDVELVGAYDVRALFVEAAGRFAPQKGATPADVELLRARLGRLAERYLETYGVDVRSEPGAGAAGGMGGAIMALGGHLESGYRLVAGILGLDDALRRADLVVTGEGALDASSFTGKVVGGVVGDAAALGVPVLVVAGRVGTDGREIARGAGGTVVEVVSLTDRYGEALAVGGTIACVEAVVGEVLGSR